MSKVLVRRVYRQNVQKEVGEQRTTLGGRLKYTDDYVRAIAHAYIQCPA